MFYFLSVIEYEPIAQPKKVSRRLQVYHSDGDAVSIPPAGIPHIPDQQVSRGYSNT